MKQKNEEVVKETRRERLAAWAKDHATELVCGAVYGSLGIFTTCVSIKLYKDNKRMHGLWTAATEAFRAGNKEYDYGPYKVASFSEPFGEKIGDILMHQDAVKAFLDCEK